MKKLNNKGFAISTLLYGIMIMVFLVVFALMSILGSTRKNTKNLVSQIEEELNMYSSTNMTMMYDPSITGARKYIAPSNGWYKVELWSSKFTYATSANLSNKGSYASGMIYLEANKHIYIHLGSDSDANNTFNSDSYITLSEDYATTIMKVSGGRPPGMSENPKILGHAGTQIDGSNNTTETFYIEYGDFNEYGESIKSSITPVFYDGLVVKDVWDNIGKFKISKISDNAKDNPPNKGINNKLNNVRYIKDCVTGNSENNDAHWIEFQAIDINGNNKAKGITPTGSNLINSSYITDGIIDDLNNYGIITGNDSTTEKCVTIDLGSVNNLSEIAVWHYYDDNRAYYNHNLEVSSDNSNWKSLRSLTYNEYSKNMQKETSLGIRYSSFQPVDILPDGKYYIFSTSNENANKVITQNGNSTKMSLFQASEDQKWEVIRNNDGTYIIKSVNNHKVLEKSSASLICQNNLNAANQNQKWTISDSNQPGYRKIFDPAAQQGHSPSYAITISGDTLLPSSLNSENTQKFEFVKIN